MNTHLQSTGKPDISGLVEACHQNNSENTLSQFLNPVQWEGIAPYLQPFTLVQAQVLITQGSKDRTVFFVETGSLSVHYEDEAGRVRLAIVGPGSAVGEGSFFSHLPRNATVQAASPGKIWGLTPIRFGELSHRQPNLALALGALVSKRMFDRRKKVSVT